MLSPALNEKLPKLALLFKEQGVKRAYIFGSAISTHFNDESDIDLLISFEDDLEPLEKGTRWWNLHDSLRTVFNREIDLLIEDTLKNPFFIEELNEKKELIYAA